MLGQPPPKADNISGLYTRAHTCHSGISKHTHVISTYLYLYVQRYVCTNFSVGEKPQLSHIETQAVPLFETKKEVVKTDQPIGCNSSYPHFVEISISLL